MRAHGRPVDGQLQRQLAVCVGAFLSLRATGASPDGEHSQRGQRLGRPRLPERRTRPSRRVESRRRRGAQRSPPAPQSGAVGHGDDGRGRVGAVSEDQQAPGHGRLGAPRPRLRSHRRRPPAGRVHQTRDQVLALVPAGVRVDVWVGAGPGLQSAQACAHAHHGDARVGGCLRLHAQQLHVAHARAAHIAAQPHIRTGGGAGPRPRRQLHCGRAPQRGQRQQARAAHRGVAAGRGSGSGSRRVLHEKLDGHDHVVAAGLDVQVAVKAARARRGHAQRDHFAVRARRHGPHARHRLRRRRCRRRCLVSATCDGDHVLFVCVRGCGCGCCCGVSGGQGRALQTEEVFRREDLAHVQRLGKRVMHADGLIERHGAHHEACTQEGPQPVWVGY